MGVWTGDPTSASPNGEWGWQWLLVVPMLALAAVAAPFRWVWRKMRGL